MITVASQPGGGRAYGVVAINDPHTRAQRRTLAYHQVVADRLRNPTLEEARHQLGRWREDGRIDPRYADRWAAILDLPIPEIRHAITDPTRDGDDYARTPRSPAPSPSPTAATSWSR